MTSIHSYTVRKLINAHRDDSGDVDNEALLHTINADFSHHDLVLLTQRGGLEKFGKLVADRVLAALEVIEDEEQALTA